MPRLDKELRASDPRLDDEQQTLPIGDPDMGTGEGVNNIVLPSTPVQGCLYRLLATRKENGK